MYLSYIILRLIYPNGFKRITSLSLFIGVFFRSASRNTLPPRSLRLQRNKYFTTDEILNSVK